MSPNSWVNQISDNCAIINISENGISEYRIYRKFLDVRDTFCSSDIVIFCHTNPHRIYLPDRVQYPTRQKNSHPECDLVLGDVNRHGIFWRFVSYIFIKYFYDEEYYNTLYDLMIADMNKIENKVIHISGFEPRNSIVSIKDIFEKHPGNINHLDDKGNKLVAERISKLL